MKFLLQFTEPRNDRSFFKVFGGSSDKTDVSISIGEITGYDKW